MEIHVLWQPEMGSCSCCARQMNVRRFSSPDHNSTYCSSCWGFYLEECNIEWSSWTQEIAQEWENDIALELQCGDTYGASQDSIEWN